MDWLVIIRNAEDRLRRGDPKALLLLAQCTTLALNELALIAADPRWRPTS